MPTTHDSSFKGAKALTSITGDGAYVQYGSHLYQLTCNIDACFWTIMEQELKIHVHSATIMHLPTGLKDDCVCENLAWSGDGFCNDETNNADCNFDGGDCCGSCINTEFCSDCTCFVQGTSNLIVNPLVGDGFCNDHTNHRDCNFDGGDCCGPCINTKHCTECSCHSEIFSNGIANALVDDGICQDATNVENCNYDGYDCCGDSANTEFCTKCICNQGM